MPILRLLIVAGVPFLAAAVAVLAYPFWVLGIPGDSDAAYAPGWFLGYMALSLYLPAYGVGLLAFGLAWLFKWPVRAWIHAYMWLCLVPLLLAMGVALEVAQTAVRFTFAHALREPLDAVADAVAASVAAVGSAG